jgi:Ribbon-helix-helix protein, copG family
MTLINPSPTAETVTFRIDPASKAAFAEIAAREAKPVGELLRELVRERVEHKRRRDLEVEARRQSLEAAATARDPTSDEATVMREIEADLDDFADKWR